jgi:hypothetical protein
MPKDRRLCADFSIPDLRNVRGKLVLGWCRGGVEPPRGDKPRRILSPRLRFLQPFVFYSLQRLSRQRGEFEYSRDVLNTPSLAPIQPLFFRGIS